MSNSQLTPKGCFDGFLTALMYVYASVCLDLKQVFSFSRDNEEPELYQDSFIIFTERNLRIC